MAVRHVQCIHTTRGVTLDSLGEARTTPTWKSVTPILDALAGRPRHNNAHARAKASTQYQNVSQKRWAPHKALVSIRRGNGHHHHYPTWIPKNIRLSRVGAPHRIIKASLWPLVVLTTIPDQYFLPVWAPLGQCLMPSLLPSWQSRRPTS